MACVVRMAVYHRQIYFSPLHIEHNCSFNKLCQCDTKYEYIFTIACNLVYLGAVDVESLTGPGAVQMAMEKLLSDKTNIQTIVVNFKVNQQGITLTDNDRK